MNTMGKQIEQIDAQTLKSYFHDGGEVALLDAREEVPFDSRHIFMASCVPIGRLECLVDTLVPRRSVRVVWCDDGEGCAQLAAERMSSLGWADIHVLSEGLSGWEKAGHRIYSGMHVPSKAFAELIECDAGTPHISADELKAMLDNKSDVVLFDTRTFEEYHGNSIPNAISAPGAELVYRFKDMVPSSETKVVINCGGRTRSIIGAEALRVAGYPNDVVSLANGTQGWHLAGYDIIDGANRAAPEVSANGLAVAKDAAKRVAKRAGIRAIDLATLSNWRKENEIRTLYLFDVRTAKEFEAGHLKGAKHIAGGQLVQETDRHCATWGARVVLIDDTSVRATFTAYWMKQMGWDVATFSTDGKDIEIETGIWSPNILGLEDAGVNMISAAELRSSMDAGAVQVVDLAMSKEYLNGHIPGAAFALRSQFPRVIGDLSNSGTLVLTSPDGKLARLAAAQLTPPAKALAGGTNAWVSAGFKVETGPERMLSEALDIRLKAREEVVNKEEAMKAYLNWEIDLADKMRTEDDQRYDIIRG